MTAQQYETIIAIAQEGNLTRAAKKLGVALPYLSKQVQQIEQELGSPILDRIGANSRLNDVGKEIEQGAYELRYMEHQLQQEMIDLMGKSGGVLSIGTSAYRSVYQFPEILVQLSRKYKGIQIKLMEGPVETMEPMARQGIVDLAITAAPSGHPALVNRFLATEELVLAVPSHFGVCAPQSDGEDRCPELDLRQLRDLPFLFLNEGAALHQLARGLLADAHIRPAACLESKSLETIYTLVREGVGAALLPRTMMRNGPEGGALQFFSVKGRRLERDIYAIYRADSYLSLACQEFLSLFQRSLEKAV